MRKLILNAVVSVICAAGVPSGADAQPLKASLELSPPQAVAPAQAGLGGAGELRQDFFSGAALETFRAERRSPLLLPVVGALVGAAGLTGWTFYECSQMDCIIDPVVPAVVGAVGGAAVGVVVELGLRVAGR